MRKMACMSSPLALAEPVPFTLASLKAKLLVRVIWAGWSTTSVLHKGEGARIFAYPRLPSDSARRRDRSETQRSFVFEHDATSLHERARRENILLGVIGLYRQTPAHVGLLSVWALWLRHPRGQTSTHASHSMHSRSTNTVCTSQLRQRSTSRTVCSGVNPSSTSMFEAPEALEQVDVRHLGALHRIVVVAVAPLMNPHLLTDEIHPIGEPLGRGRPWQWLWIEMGGRVAVSHGPDDVLRGPMRHRRRRTRRDGSPAW